MQFESRNPFTNELIQAYEFTSRESISSTIEQLHHAYIRWKDTTIDERSKIIEKLAEALQNNKESLATTICMETAKPIRQARSEIDKCIQTCYYFATNATSFLAATKINKHATLYYQPLGVIVGIMPWNFPIWQAIRFAIPTLLAGNTVFIKHAPTTPQSSLLLEKIFQEVYPINTIYHQSFVAIEDIDYLISLPFVQGVSLTGSTEAGRSIAQVAAKYLKKYVLELGGSDPFIVCKDADLDSLIQVAIDSRCRNNGQSCIAAKRFIIDETIIEQFKEKLILSLEKISYALPSNEDAYITAVARSDLKTKTETQLEQLASFGFDLVYAYETEHLSMNTVFPKIYQVQEARKFENYTDELFAPIFLLYSFQSIEEAIQIANNTSYGLGASVWTLHEDWIEQLSMQIDAGMVYINEMTISEATYPFGGIKNSGVGKELGALGIKEFMNTKLVYKK